MIDYLNLEDVAVQRGEKSDLLARKLVANGCYLYLWFDNNRKHKAMMLFPGVSKKEMDYEIDQGTYPLTQGSREALIKILNRGENTTEGLEILIESDDGFKGFKGFVTYQVRLTEEDKSVCVVVNPDDVAKLPPLPKSIEGASVQRGGPSAKNNFQISEKNYHKNKKSNPELHKIFWRAFVHLRDKDEFPVEPQYKQVWQAIYDDVNNSDIEDSLTEHRKFDPKDIIEKIDSIGITKTTKLFWLFATAGGETLSQGDYSLSSLPSLLNKLKKSPQDIIS